MRRNPLQDSETRCHRHVFADQREGVFGRSEATVREGDAREPARGAGQRQGNVEAGEMPGIDPDHLSNRGWVGGKQRDLGIIDLPIRYTGPFPILFFGLPEIEARFLPARPGLQKSGGFRFQKIRVRS